MSRHLEIIQQFAISGYQVDVPWRLLKSHLDHYKEAYSFEMCPDFQRGHIWTEEQQIAFLEWTLKGGLEYSGRHIYLNCPAFKCGGKNAPMELVDGLQRVTAALNFLDEKIIVFGKYSCKDLQPLDMCTVRFTFHIADIQNKRDVLQWYIDFNSAGTVHTKDELDRVRVMMQGLDNSIKRKKCEKGTL